MKDFRKLERLGHQFTKRIVDVAFWNRCLDLGLCPEFLKFKAPRVKQYDSVNSLYNAVVQNSLRIAVEDQSKAKRMFYNMREAIFRQLSMMEQLTLIHLLNKSFDETREEMLQRHNRKLLNMWMKDRPRSPNCLRNFSDRSLTVEETNVLYRGLKHHVLPRKVQHEPTKVSIENIVNNAVYEKAISHHPGSSRWRDKTPEEKEGIRKSILNTAQNNVDCAFRDNIKVAFYSFMSSCRRVCSTRSNQRFHESLSSLANDEHIKVCKFDKGTGVCVLNSIDYFAKLDIIINDKSKFEEVVSKRSNAKHPVLKRQEVVKDSLNRLLKGHITDDLLHELSPKGSSPGKLYGMCKIHKKDNPMRPVVSMIGTAEYQLAKYLDSLIKPNLPQTFMLNSTTDFLEKLKKFKIQPGDKMISFDVRSLFTNIPLLETIQIIADYLYSDSAVLTPPFEKETFISLLKIATGGLFMHRDTIFQQTDGVTMGNPLGVTLANFFMAHCEELIFNSVTQFFPTFYARYIDDIFCIFRSDVDWKPFFSLLNSMHPNLQFTFEESSGSLLPFLDVHVHLRDGGSDTWVFRKKTHTNVILNFQAVAPIKWKSGLITCFLNRAHRICSSVQLFYKEVEFLKSMFIQNAYPAQFFDRVYQKFLKKLKNTEVLNTTDEEKSLKFNLKVPFIGKESIKFGKKISALMRQKFDVDVNVVYATTQLGSFFRLKCKTPTPILSCVIYKFVCLGDQTDSYIGMTERHMTTRVGDHLRKGSKTAVANHIKTCQTCSSSKLSIDNFSIINKCRNDRETKIYEALKITSQNPKMNRQHHHNRGASFILNIFN